ERRLRVVLGRRDRRRGRVRRRAARGLRGPVERQPGLRLGVGRGHQRGGALRRGGPGPRGLRERLGPGHHDLKEHTPMASTDWTFLNDGLDIATVDRGVTAGVARPPGGGSFLYAFNSLAAVEGCVALFANLVDFAPMAKGGSIRGVVQRGPGGGPTGFSPFLYLCCQGNSVNDQAYLLGLSDDDPHRVVLRKGTVTTGLPAADGPGVLLTSSESFAQATWLHLRLDVIVNANGDVVLKVFRNDLGAHALGTPPDWQPVPG